MKLFVIFLLLVGLTHASNDFESAYSLYKEAKYKKALEAFESLVKESNDLNSASILAKMYEEGKGCEVDIEKSLDYYKLALSKYSKVFKENSREHINKKQSKNFDFLKKVEDFETHQTIRQKALSLYNIKAYKDNYFLPISYREKGVYALTKIYQADRAEVEFQLSLRYDFQVDSIGMGLGEFYSIGFSQHSFWQSYTESAYFRETNYNPEFFMTLPLHSLYQNEYLKSIKLSLSHQSNGRGGIDERSWNYFSGSFFFQYKLLFMEFAAWHRFPDAQDYNPQLLEYLGYGHLKFSIPYKRHLVEVLLRNSFSTRRATAINYSYPAFGKKDFFLYVKFFNGYGESLIDYDQNLNKIGVGFSISR
jgi:phospholipase A1